MRTLPPPRELVNGGLFLTGGAALQALAGFAAQVVLMRILAPEDFGAFALVLAWCGLVHMVLSFRINALIMRADPDRLARRRQVYFSALVIETGIALAVTLGWIWAVGLMSAPAVILVSALALAQWTNQVVAFHERAMAYRRLAIAETGSQLFGHAVAVGLAIGGAGVLALYLREFCANLAKLIVFHRIGAIETSQFVWPSWSEWRALGQEARDLWLDGLVESGFGRLVILVAGVVGGTHAAGLFFQAQRLALVPHQFLSPVTSRQAANIFGRMTEPHERRQMLLRLLVWSLAGLGVAAALTLAFSDPIVPLVFGDQWAAAAPVLAAMAGVIMLHTGFELLRVYRVTIHQTHRIIWARLTQYGVFAAGTGLATYLLGADPIGLALALSASYGALFGVAWIGITRR